MDEKKYKIGEEFTPSKTQDKYIHITFKYNKNHKWEGCLPLYNEKNGLDYDIEELKEKMNTYYLQLDEVNKEKTIEKLKDRWKQSKTTETHKVFMSLTKCEWICRTCITGKINDQPPARIRDIKKFGFTIATKNIRCLIC